MSARKPKRSACSPRRKAGRIAARKTKRIITFRFVVEAQELVVVYTPNYFDGTYAQAHFEFRSPFEPPRRTIVSETGYLSHFAPMAEIEASASPQDYARDFVLAVLAGGRKEKPAPSDHRQLRLF
ncbi:MAG TPA: hypothetical protein VMF32_17190 [Xanthobacteraceae bacterium]|nr:hypothetical protein [Xanthobacteraceae bacterium]